MREQKKKSTYVENLEAVRDKLASESTEPMDDEQRMYEEEMKVRRRAS